jgi:hypothetical protein
LHEQLTKVESATLFKQFLLEGITNLKRGDVFRDDIANNGASPQNFDVNNIDGSLPVDVVEKMKDILSDVSALFPFLE